VLSSFARCLASDILCVWRRSPNSKPTQPTTPHDLFTPTTPNSQNQFMPAGQTPPQQQLSMQPPQMPQHQMMPPQMPMGMGPSHLGPHHMTGPPAYPQGSLSHHDGSSLHTQGGHHPHNQGPRFSPQPSPMLQPLFNQTYNNPNLNGPKELWIFWYGEQPDLSGLVSPQLIKSGL